MIPQEDYYMAKGDILYAVVLSHDPMTLNDIIQCFENGRIRHLVAFLDKDTAINLSKISFPNVGFEHWYIVEVEISTDLISLYLNQKTKKFIQIHIPSQEVNGKIMIKRIIFSLP